MAEAEEVQDEARQSDQAADGQGRSDARGTDGIAGSELEGRGAGAAATAAGKGGGGGSGGGDEEEKRMDGGASANPPQGPKGKSTASTPQKASASTTGTQLSSSRRHSTAGASGLGGTKPKLLGASGGRSSSTKGHGVEAELSMSVGRTKIGAARSTPQNFSSFLERQKSMTAKKQATLDHQAKISDWDRLKERGIVPKDFRVKVSKGQEFESFLQRQNAAWEKKKKIVAMGPTRITTDVVKPPPRMDGPGFQEFLERQTGFAERTMTRCLVKDETPKVIVDQERLDAFIERESQRHAHFDAACKKIEEEMWAAALAHRKK